tara:strand:- start:1918 stop:7614 length:5697 start_codon:yes stop_codon:yes gene_type:complete
MEKGNSTIGNESAEGEGGTEPPAEQVLDDISSRTAQLEQTVGRHEAAASWVEKQQQKEDNQRLAEQQMEEASEQMALKMDQKRQQLLSKLEHEKRIVYDFIQTSYMQWVIILSSAILMYPWVYEILSASICKHGGTINLWTLRCNCPAVYNDNADCSTCQVNPARGQCGYNAVARFGYGAICNDKWTGVMCNDCNAQCINPVNGICSNCTGDCNYAQSWYENSQTGRCTVTCRADARCSGHGRCTEPYGSCICDEGYSTSAAVSGQSGAECNVECPDKCVRNGVKRGDCINGECKCMPGFAGIGCQLMCPIGSNGIFCSGHGSCNDKGLCECNKQGDMPLYVGDECQFACPFERGVVCNDKNAKCIEHGGMAQCECKAGNTVSRQPHVCNCNCHERGLCGKNGCVCHSGFDTATDCTTCLPFYMSKQSNCSQYCNPDITCMGRGSCRKAQNGDIICAGDGCKNFDRRVTDHIQSLFPVPLLVVPGTSGSIEVNDTVGKSQFFMQASEIGTDAETNYSITPGKIDFATTAEFKLVTPTYEKLNPIVLESYVARTLPDGACPSTDDDDFRTSCSECEGCAGIVHSKDKTVYLACAKKGSRLSAPCGNGATELYKIYYDLTPADVYLRHNTATLRSKIQYRIMVQKSTPKGCTECLPNYYPSLEYANAHNMTACSVFCDAKKCAHFGTCNDEGKCVCNTTFSYTMPLTGKTVKGTHLNASENCGKCDEKWYPAPSELAHARHFHNKTIMPCTVFCDHSQINNSTCPPHDEQVRGLEAMKGGCNYCSNNGYCTSIGLCDCSSNATRLPTGFLPPHCDTSCNKKQDTVCNGHGKCELLFSGDGNCLCDDGWFGEGCQFGATREDQQFWYKAANGTVFSKQCNGGIAKLTSHYKITLSGRHTYELSNQTCTTAVAQQQGQKPEQTKSGFHCCFGNNYNHLSVDQKNKMFTEWGCADAMNQSGVFCDTAAINNINEGIMSYNGTCKSIVCDCDTVPGTAGEQISGPGCQLSDCGVSTFRTFIGAETQTHSSVCGRYPPDGATDSCIRGECLPIHPERSGMSRKTPAVSNDKFTTGYCGCNASPDRETTYCAKSTDTPDWVYNCCGRAKGESFSGRGCGKYCVCQSAISGTCAVNTATASGITGTTCFCRQNKEGTNLFCGDTCSVQCGGTIAKNISTITKQEVITRGVVLNSAHPYCSIIETSRATSDPDLQTDAPGASSPTPTPANHILPQDPRCFSNVFPCNGNGECANPSTGTCFSNDGKCRCYGASVPIGGSTSVIADSVFDDNPLLFTGENCMFRCPQTDTQSKPDVFQYFKDNKHLLEVAEIGDGVEGSQERTNALKQYYALYKQQICNGHGYCAESDSIKPQCQCYGDYGGDSCEEKCSIAKIDVQTADIPIQYSQAEILEIADRFRLQPCGARKICKKQDNGGVACATADDAVLWQQNTESEISKWSHGKAKTEADWLPLYTQLLNDRFALGEDRANDILHQFPMVFASHIAGQFNAVIEECYSNYASEYYAEQSNGDKWAGYFTGESGSLITNGLEAHSEFLPVPVRWQMNRTCDSWCHPMSSDVSQPAEKPKDVSSYDGVRCCRRCVSDWDAIDLNPYGGCAECPNYATGRSCTQCSRGFDPTIVHFNDVGSDAGNCTAEQEFHEGACAVCQGSNTVYPEVAPNTGGEELKSTFPHCLPCLGASGRFDVCGGLTRGQCIGAPETFSSRQIGGSTIVKEGDLLEQNTYNFTQCKCNEDWSGPTCSVPLTDIGCNLGSLATNGKYCTCRKGTSYFSGPYCDSPAPTPVETSKLIPPFAQYLDGKWVLCNGRGHLSDLTGQCVCDDDHYDPDTMCLELKQTESDQRRADVCMCDLQGRGVQLQAAETQCMKNLRGIIQLMRTIIFRDCKQAFSFIDTL